jgi:hypothetical protein
MGQYSVTGTAIRQGLDRPGIESWWGRISASVQIGSGPTEPPIQWVTPVFNRPRSGINHPPLSSAELTERVALRPYSTSVPSRQVLSEILNL